MTGFWLFKTKITFELPTLKLGYISIFKKIWEKYFFGSLLSDSWIIEAKTKMKKFHKTSTISELTALKLGYNTNFHESLRKKLWHSFEWFSTHWDKMKMKLKKFQKTSTIFELSTLNLGHSLNLHENLRKKTWLNFDKFLTNQDKNEDEDDEIWQSKYDFWTLHPKISF